MRSKVYLPETASALEALEEKVAKAWQLHHTSLDKVIWHYTDVTGLVNIIQSGVLRATNAFYLNDSMEVDYARELIKDEVARQRGTLPAPVDEFLSFVDASVQITRYVFEPYVTCFSGEAARDLLSQWRAYGDNGSGYAIGFIPKNLAQLSTVNLRKIIYEQITQRELIENALSAYSSELPAVSRVLAGNPARLNEAIRDFSHSFSKILHEYIYCFKDKSWREEQEWRIVRQIVPFKAAGGVPDVTDLSFRPSKSGSVIPFTDLDIREKDPDDDVKRMPVSEILIGPKLPEMSALHSVKLLLERNDYEGRVTLTKSRISLV
jgi:hypothetical protein